ncbi:MAG: LysR family transcriptional regulator [Woeseiaceae bacterium]|nr:LysR family transcriptional regulator [Woeseiaceae bacterium]
MEMNQVRYFLAVCEHRNFTHAARASYVSQPSLTAAIKKLEDEFGGALFLRDRAGCRLTPLGALVRPHIEAVQQQALEAKNEAIRYNRLERVPVSIGLGETVGQNWIAKSIERYRRSFPESDIELIVDSQSSLLEGLREGSLDVAVTSGEANDELYRVDPLYSEEYRAVVAADHELRNHSGVSLETLSKTNMLDRLNCEMRESLHQTCAERGHDLYAAYRSNRLEWLLAMARKGSGVVVLPDSSIPDEPSLVSLPIDGLEMKRNIFALRYSHQPSRPEIETLVKEMARQQRKLSVTRASGRRIREI